MLRFLFLPRRKARSERKSAEGERVEAESVPREGSAGSQRERAASVGKPGSGGRREEETPEEADYYNTHIGPIMDEMATHIKGYSPLDYIMNQ